MPTGAPLSGAEGHTTEAGKKKAGFIRLRLVT